MNRELLQRYVERDVTEEEIGQVVEWLDADPSHVREYRALHKLHAFTVLNPLGATAPADRPNRSRKIWREIGKVAAVVVAVVAIGRLVPIVNSPTNGPVAMQAFHVPAGQRARVELPDGTQVWVNAKSTLTYPVDFGRRGREVTLDGEARFDVEADAKRPFLVNTPEMKVVVTGTEFNVSSYGGSGVCEVALLEGEVSLYPSGDGELLRKMSPGEQARFSENRLQVSAITNYDYFRWSEGLLCFNNETVRDIFDKLELYFDITIDVEHEKLLEYRYTGKFRTKDGIEQVLKTIQMELRFKFEKDTDNNRIIVK